MAVGLGSRRIRIGLRGALIGVALLALALSMASRYLQGASDFLGGDSIRFEFVNASDRAIGVLSIRYPGGSIEARDLHPGESFRGRIWPNETDRIGDAIDCPLEVRVDDPDGTSAFHLRLYFRPDRYAPEARIVLRDYPDSLSVASTTDRPTPGYVRTLRRWLGR
ncbi:MAG: hypothetical protein U0800_18040 [Isosphaeraceae bacterium]